MRVLVYGYSIFQKILSFFFFLGEMAIRMVKHCIIEVNIGVILETKVTGVN